MEFCAVCLSGPARCVCPYYHDRVLRVSDLWWRPEHHNRPNPFD